MDELAFGREQKRGQVHLLTRIMPRKARVTLGGMVFHVLNRGVGRRQLFETDVDYDAFESTIAETLDKCPMRTCGYYMMPNHWHFVMWPEGDDDLGLFMQRLSVTHVTRWQKHRNVVGEGHLYQARFKSFPVETEDYFYQVMLYVERNALRANLCQRAEDWRWVLCAANHSVPPHGFKAEPAISA